MGKKSRMKRERREAKKRESAKPVFGQISNPFSEMPQEEVLKAFSEFGKHQADQYPQARRELEETLAKSYPPFLLASIAAYGLVGQVGEDGAVRDLTEGRIQPADVELAQALFLMRPLTDYDVAFALPEVLDQFSKQVRKWSEAFHFKRLVQLQDSQDEQARHRMAAQEDIRLTTQIVRNWAYIHQVKRIVCDLFLPLEERVEAALGFRASDVVAVFGHLLSEIESRLNAHWNRLAPMVAARTVPAAVAEYYRANPGLNDNQGQMVKYLQNGGANLRTAQSMMMSHADLMLPAVFEFDFKAIAREIQRPLKVVEKVFTAMGISFGELAGANIEHFFMNNPVWTRPAIVSGKGNALVPMPQLFFGFPFESILRLIKHDPALLRAYDDRRSDFLESQVAELFRRAFPDASITPGFKWKTPDRTQEFENDICRFCHLRDVEV